MVRPHDIAVLGFPKSQFVAFTTSSHADSTAEQRRSGKNVAQAACDELGEVPSRELVGIEDV